MSNSSFNKDIQRLREYYGLTFDKTKLKDTRNRALTKSLFIEYENNQYHCKDFYPPLYNLRDYNYKDTIPIKNIYVDLADPTEYKFANICFWNWDHWDQVRNLHWFKPYYKAWKKELQMKMQSDALTSIMNQASIGGKESITAAKYIASEGWKKNSKRGRPTAEEEEGALNEYVRSQMELSDDAERIGLKVVEKNE